MGSCDRHRWWSGPAGAVIVIVGLVPAAAHADPVEQKVLSYTAMVAPTVCVALDKYPNPPGVAGVMRGLVEDSGFTAEQVSQVVTLSVISECPRHTALLKRIIAAYGPPTAQLT